MILVFIFLGLILVASSIMVFFVLSNIKIKICDLNINNFKLENKNYKIWIQIYFLNRIKIFSFKIDDKKIKRMSLNTKIQSTKLKEIIKDKNIIKSIKRLQLRLESLRLNLDIGTEDAPVTAYLTSAVSGIIGVNLPKIATAKDLIGNRVYYRINPIYNRNILKINLIESIISIKIVHIISMLIYGSKRGELIKWKNIQ